MTEKIEGIDLQEQLISLGCGGKRTPVRDSASFCLKDRATMEYVRYRPSENKLNLAE